MQTIMVYSEAGGVSKTTTAVSIAMVAAQGIEADAKNHLPAVAPRRVVLVDLDPRAASTKWLRAQPVEEGLHIGAILGNDDSAGWAKELAVPANAEAGWSENLRIIPSTADLSNVEGERNDFAELRLSAALEGLDADLVVIDCANRPGGILTLNALYASQAVIYAATATDSGVDGVDGAQRTVHRFTAAQQRLGTGHAIHEAGSAISRDGTGFMSFSETDAVELITKNAPRLGQLIPHLSIVPESRLRGEWYGRYRKGGPIRQAYETIMREVIR
ncbi:ParA family protein [Microbacterium amylolyticum]|uniref:Cellulose biosynthesis protein BcsQ n=1 Tax=Microbacterium amylolyticum TaxID=936337 RepID=A0ABS4ZLL4_9MICO|nr:ParA family protein [Microbacterium amylolyticum]MBP2437888.1 cellulose biosynthesis protein BcsQ [Microbacterium amylolyticum]